MPQVFIPKETYDELIRQGLEPTTEAQLLLRKRLQELAAAKPGQTTLRQRR